MTRPKTRLDQTVEALKNRKGVAWLLLCFIVAVGLGQFSDALAKIATAIEIIGAPAEEVNKDPLSTTLRPEISLWNERALSAIQEGDAAGIRTLLNEGLPVDFLLDSEMPAVAYAAGRNEVNIARLLLENGASPDAAWGFTSATPLMVASMQGDLEMIRLLIQYGAVVDTEDNDGLRALHWAAMGCNPSAAEELLSAEADPNARDDLGASALIYAVEACNKDQLVEHQLLLIRLVAGGADLNARDNDGKTAFDYADAESQIAGLLERLSGKA